MRLPSLIPYLIAAVAGVSVYLIVQPALQNSDTGRRGSTGSELVGQPRPDFSLHDYNGTLVSINQYDGQLLLINFWASWCPPCRKEIPEFIDVYTMYHAEGFTIIGIAIDDQHDAEAFIKAMPNLDYPQLIGYDDAIEVAKKFGNRGGGLPYSALIDRQGIIRATHAGSLNKEELIDLIEPFLTVGQYRD